MRIIDFHTHIYPDGIAEKAAKSIGNFYDLPVRYDGKLSTMMRAGQRAGIDQFVVFSVATTTHQVRSINDYIHAQVEAFPTQLIGVAAMHPDFEDVEGELDRIGAMGLRGVKVHPDFQRFRIDDERMMPIYQSLERRGMPIIVHTGDTRFEFSQAEYVLAVMERCPNLIMVCAHMGGWSQWEHAAKCLKGSGVYVDTSSTQGFISPEGMMALIDAYGDDHVIFGTDYPMWDAQEELDMLMKLPLKGEQLERILYLNAKRILKL